MKEEKPTIKEGIAILIVILLIIALFFVGYNTSIRPAEFKECLKPIAEKFCEDRNMVFDFVTGYSFQCKENIRALQINRYKFLEDEIEECKNKVKGDD